MWTAEAAATGTTDLSARMWGCERRRKRRDRKQKKLRALTLICHHWHGRERVMWLVVETMLTNTRKKGRRQCRNTYSLPFGSKNNHTWTPVPMPADNPKCPPLSSFQKDNIQLSYGEDQRDPLFQRCRFGIPTHLCKRTEKEKKNLIDVFCSRELTGYVCVTVRVIMLLYLLSLI